MIEPEVESCTRFQNLRLCINTLYSFQCQTFKGRSTQKIDGPCQSMLLYGTFNASIVTKDLSSARRFMYIDFTVTCYFQSRLAFSTFFQTQADVCCLPLQRVRVR